MTSYPFLPTAVQTAYQGELSVRREVSFAEIPAVRLTAKTAGITYRTVRVTDSEGPDQYWAFSNIPIPYHEPNRTPPGERPAEGRLAARQS